MEYHRLDDDHVEVLAGDLPGGFWTYAGGELKRDGIEAVNLEKNTEKLQLRKSQKVSNIDTVSDLPASNLIGMALGSLLGPAGGILNGAFGLIAGRKEFVCIGCELKEGRKFIARMSAAVYKRWRQQCGQD